MLPLRWSSKGALLKDSCLYLYVFDCVVDFVVDVIGIVFDCVVVDFVVVVVC